MWLSNASPSASHRSRTMCADHTELSISAFERAMLCADAHTLSRHGLSDAAAVAAGHFDILTDHTDHTDHSPPPRSVIIARSCIQSSNSQAITRSHHLSTALVDAVGGDKSALYACYVAGVALVQAFVRHNWAGPSRLSKTPQDDTAAFFLIVDGEDVARPATFLHGLRAARFILVDAVDELLRAGAQLVPWWATRVLLAHQSVLSNVAPTLQHHLFRMYARFLGPHTTDTLYLSGKPPLPLLQHQTHPVDDSEHDLLPPPVQEGLDDIADEEEDYALRFDMQSPADRELLTLAYLELSRAQKLYYNGDAALQSLNKACALAAVGFRVSGEMGVRTKFQEKPTAQLIGRAFRIHAVPYTPHPCDAQTCLSLHFPSGSETQNEHSTSSDDKPHADGKLPSLPLPRNVPLNDTDALGYVKLTESPPDQPSTDDDADDDDGGIEDAPEIQYGAELEQLTPLQQAMALCHASVVRARNASHILTKEEMAPYVNLVLRSAQTSKYVSSVIQIRALLMRVSFERDRGRYLERCMAQMEVLGKFVDDPMHSADSSTRASAALERNLFTFAASLPPRWELKKELAISFGKIGLVKSAMQIFEDLEFWDELVDCHRLIGNLGAAEELVRKQLESLDEAMLEDGTLGSEETTSGFTGFRSSRAVQARATRRPRLLCVLGDVTRNREHFETAWQESGHRYARAKRALGHMCVEAEEWEDAATHFREALKVNGLFPDTWFTYGCAAIRINDMRAAANAFTRVVQQTPENGEAWNNLGRVLHELGKKKEALRALTEAGRRKRDSWRIWNNILIIAVELPSSLDIVRSMERLLEIRGKDGVEADAIGVAVAEVTRMSSSEDIEDKALVGPVTKRLLKVLGRCTALVSTNPSIWAAYAQLCELVPGDDGKQKAFDCRLRQVRSLLAHGEWKREIRMFRHMILATDSLVKDALESGNSLNTRAAGLHIDSVIEQTRDDFKRNNEFSRLLEIQSSLRNEKEEERVSTMVDKE